MTLLEAELMGVVSFFLGTASGILLAIVLIYVINKQSFGWTFLYKMPPWTGVISFVLIIVAAILAAIPPANAASRVNLAELLKGS